MRISVTPAVAMMAIKLDGNPDTGVPERRCSICRKYMIQFVVSPGLQAASGLPNAEAVCCNTKHLFGLPCPGALSAKKYLDALGRVASA